MKWYEWYWTFLVGGFIVAFLAVEIPALLTGHPERTLSYWVWRRIENWVPGMGMPLTWQHVVFGIIIFGLFIWLAVHFTFGVLR